MDARLKIAVVGCGAVGSYYGGRLTLAGHDVRFLLRSDYDHVRKNGLRVESPSGNFNVRPGSAREPGEIGPCDLVLIALKTTANDQLPALLPPLLNDETIVVTLQNGLGNEEGLASLVSPRNIVGGLCFVCLNRVAPGLIRHIAHGLVVLGDFVPGTGTLGESALPCGTRVERLAELFKNSGVPCRGTENLARARWEKLTWNIPFNGLGVAGAAGLEAVTTGRVTSGIVQPCLMTDFLVSDPRWSGILRDLMIEVIRGARRLGYEIPDAMVEVQMDRTRSMGPYKASTLVDFENRLPLELNSMFLEPLRRAKAAGAPMPWLDRVCAILTDLEKLNRK